MFIVGLVRIFTSSFSFFCSSLDLSDSNRIIDTSSTSIDCEQSSSFINPLLEDGVNGPAKILIIKISSLKCMFENTLGYITIQWKRRINVNIVTYFLWLEVAYRSISLEKRLLNP